MMVGFRWRGALSVLALGCLASLSGAEEIWRVDGGRTSISFNTALAKDLGLRINKIEQTAKPVSDMEDPVGFRVNPGSNYEFRVRQGAHREIIGGTIVQDGGFTLGSMRKSLQLKGFSVGARGIIGSDGYVLYSPATGTTPLFTISHVQQSFDPKTGSVGMGYADLEITPQLAKLLEKGDVAGTVIGSITIEGHATKLRGMDTVPPPPGGGPDLATDVKLEDMSGLSYQGHIGTYPTGRTAFAMSTTSCNNSATVNIDWYSPNQGGSPMDTRHPYIMQNLYRLSNGRFEQIGWAWAKHGFFATNASSCAGGSCAGGGGSILKPKCTDTYGVGNNNDRNYLGPRDEINGLTGVWNNMNSFFAMYSGNVWNSAHGSGWNAIDHRLEVNDADLTNSSGTDQLFYEANYVCKDDIDTYNNIGSRRTTISWSGTSYNVSTNDAQIFGPAVQNRWPGSSNSIAQPRTDGDAWVAVKVTDNGNGTWHYDYAVYNHTLDRAIREFAIPIQMGATVSNYGYHDLDTNTANDWVAVNSGGVIRFVGPDFATNPTGNALRFSRMFNFRFDANVGPVSSIATLGLFRPGSFSNVTATTTGPAYDYVGPWGYTVIQGVQTGGSLASLMAVDNDRLLDQLDELTPNGEIEFVGRSTAATASEFRFKVVARASRTDMIQQIQLFNYTSTAFETLDSRGSTLNDSTAEVVVTTNPARFIAGGDLTVKSRILWTPTAEVDGFDGWGTAVNQAVWKTTP